MTFDYTKALKVALLALAYFIVGKFSLLLAIPPGFATPVWPAAGIALAAVLIWGRAMLPGVFVGSFATNMLVSSEAGADIFAFGPIMVALGIAVGATVQAAIGARLVSRSVNVTDTLENPKSVISLILCGGAVACLINAIVGPLVLITAGFISFGQLGVSVITWWVGDVIGVILFAPALLLLFNDRVSSFRKCVVTLPILIFSSIAIFVFFNTKEIEEDKSQRAFDVAAREMSSEFEKDIEVYLNILSANERFIKASSFITADEFVTFTRGFTSKYDTIQSLSWNPKITHDRRAEHEQNVRAQGFPDYTVKDRFGVGKIEPADTRMVYFPIAYLSPVEGNEAAQGYDTYGPDILTNNVRRRVLNQARDEARPITTGRIALVQAEDQYGMIIYHPVFEGELDGVSVEDRRARLTGYVAGVFVMPKMLSGLQELANENGVDLVLNDITAGQLMYDSRTPDFKEPAKPISPAPHLLTSKTELDVAGHKWELTFVEQSLSGASHKSWHLWYLLVLGLIVSAAFGILIIVISARTDAMQKQLSEEKSQSDREDRKATLIAPVLSSLVVMIVSLGVWQQFKAQEQNLVKTIIDQEKQTVEQVIAQKFENSVVAIQRMAQRWEAAEGTPKAQWIADARNYVKGFEPLTTVEWVDDTYHVQWVYPLIGNEKAIGLNIAFNDERKEALKGAAEANKITITPPLDLVQGYRAVIAYVPIHVNGQFDGFMVGIFDPEIMLMETLPEEQLNQIDVVVQDAEKVIFQNSLEQGVTEFYAEGEIPLYNRSWKVGINPKPSLMNAHKSSLPELALMGGLLISLLVGFAVYMFIISQKRSALLFKRTNILRISEAELRRTGEKLSLILDNAGEGIYGLDVHGRTTFANNAALKMLGYELEEMLNESQHKLIHHHHEDGSVYPREECNIYRSMIDGKVRTEDKEVFWTKDGDPIPVEYTSKPILDRNGTVTGAVVVFRDITERRQMDIMKNEFVSTVNHELRTPLTSIRAALDMLKVKSENQLDASSKRLLHLSHENCTRLSNLVNDILDMEKIAAGRMEYFREDVEIGQLVEHIVEQNQNFADKHNVRLRVDKQIEDVTCYLDEGRFNQALSNLLSNAAKFSPEGEVVTVTIAEETDQSIRISVSDNGPGIAEEFRSKIFGKFMQADTSTTRSKGGTGLGLNITKSIIEAFKGSVGFDTEIGKGTTFYFILPKRSQSMLNADERLSAVGE